MPKVACCVFVCVYFISISVVDAYSQLHCQIQSKKDQKSYAEACQLIEKAIEPSCRTPEYFFRQAIGILNTLQKNEPHYAGIAYQKALIYIFSIEQRNLSRARSLLEEVVSACPVEFVDAYFHLAQIYYGESQYDKALRLAQDYLKNKEHITNDEYLVMAQALAADAQKKVELFGNAVPFHPEVVQGISSPYNEYFVSISPDGEIALYTRQQEIPKHTLPYAPEIGFAEKFFISTLQRNGTFDSGREMPYPFNRRQNEGSATLTIDNREMFYTVCEWINLPDRTRYYNCDIYYSRYEFGSWREIERLPENVNFSDSWESQPSISSDGKTLFFVSDRKGGFGGTDIYITVRKDDGTWSDPVNAGPVINTAGDEKSPFIHSDSQTLYFSSNGHPGLGGLDIFFSRLTSDGKWTKPQNIGYPINTEYDDFGFIVSTDGKYGYFSSDRLGLGPGGYDFYRFELHDAARPQKVLFVKGEVVQKNTQEPVAATVELKNMETKKVTLVPVDLETGRYAAVLPFKNDYLLTVKQPDYVYESVYISVDDTTFQKPATVDVQLQQIQEGQSYQLKNIYFEYDSDKLTAQSLFILDEFADFLRDNPTLRISIEGHTDNIGSAEYNIDLSTRRAQSVYLYLISKGISADRLQYKGYGFSRPIASNDTEEGRAMNRRTEFVVIKK